MASIQFKIQIESNKKTAWDVWTYYPVVTQVFQKLCCLGNDGTDDQTFSLNVSLLFM